MAMASTQAGRAKATHLQRNKSDNNLGFGYVDATFGPANTYADNKCKKLVAGVSDPIGLCKK